MKTTTLMILFAGGLACLDFASAVEYKAPSATTSPVVTKDVRYTETPGIEAASQSLDIYAPAHAKNAAVMIYVHGGGWKNGDKSQVVTASRFFTQEGIFLVSLNYRLLPTGQHPHNIEDVASAVAWVHSHIAEHGGDPAQLFLYGHSAGAHLVALLATDASRLQAAGKNLSILRGVIPLDTNAYDIPQLVERNDPTKYYASIFGADPLVLKDASPSAHVAAGRGIPPMLIFHSGTGAEVRSAQAKAFLAELHGAGVSAELVPSINQTHVEIVRDFGKPGDMVTQAAMKFIQSQRSQTTRRH